LALICAFFPLTVLVTVAAGVVLLQLYTLSLPVMAVTLIFLLLLYIMLLRFVPQRIWLVLVVLLAYIYDLPFALPVVFGLLGTTFFVVPLICGTIIYYILHYVATGYAAYVMEGLEIQGVIEIVVNFTQHSLENMEMWVMAAILVVCMLFVYAIRTRSFPHSWKVAIGIGTIALAVSIVMGPPVVGLDFSEGLFGVILMSIVVGFVLEFLFFSVDYSKTEMLQFEDNEYYYYVKAIPKLGIVKEDRKIIDEKEEFGEDEEKIDGEGIVSNEDVQKDKLSPFKKHSKEESKDRKDTRDKKDRKDTADDRDIKDKKDRRDTADDRDIKDKKDRRDTADSRDTADDRGVRNKAYDRGIKDTVDDRGIKDTANGREIRDGRDSREKRPNNRRKGSTKNHQKPPLLEKGQQEERNLQLNSHQRKESPGLKTQRPPGQRKGHPNPKQQKPNQRKTSERRVVEEDIFETKNLTDELNIIRQDKEI